MGTGQDGQHMTQPEGNPPHSSGQALLCGWGPIVTSFCALKDIRKSFYVLKNMNSLKNVDKSIACIPWAPIHGLPV